MLKYAVLFTTVFCLVQSQRPWHAGTNNNRLPQVLPQYIDERIAAEQAAQAAQTGQANLAGQPGQPDQTGQFGQPGQTGQFGQPGQTGQFGQPGQTGQFDQAGQVGLANQPGQVGVTNQPGQFGQAGQIGQGVQTNQGTPAAGANGVVDESLLGNRIGAGDANAAAAPAFSPTTQRIPFDLPIDAHGDIDLVNRIMTWPRDKQPFWFINWQAIQAHRGDVNNTAQPAETQPNSRSFFAG
ncbi:paraneoplastic antigen Ma6E [Linepithema humile]|uniref:paraneoplastic antigen Ma6E n=1 Tax=Linepithema humile TaxID=83485 RepID=UPI0006234C38|nr:PREDICTED: collagen alpha-2(I) chain-like [Linepithema humile]